ncbi:Mitogen-activated protein kinase 8 [Trypanosoma brucei equiperdum]|uniref:cyclin-dependent kinase n=1 Tax=Trypanosoma brucei equiperdum TaxID=630700 RepID=A0A3L6KV99_9TRYP|nr:Mitogen-activated protein kinase 8 [Trypanosoma brucei equiperdum]
MEDYETVAAVGEGTYGIVYKCRCKKSGRVVAIKCFKRKRDCVFSRRVILRELRALKLLVGQPGVVQLLRDFHTGGQLCLVMEYYEHNLLDIIRRNPHGVPRPQLKQILFTLLVGVRSCHHHGVVHRDLKPENILVYQGRVSFVCDLGSSRILRQPGTLVKTTSGGLLRTPTDQPGPLTGNVATRWYCSPEMLIGLPHYNFTSDMWAVGAVMAELARGMPLLPGKSRFDQLSLINQRVGDLAELGEYSKFSPFIATAVKGRESNSIAGDFLTRVYRSVLGVDGMNLLRELLSVDYRKRLTVDKALAHPFFKMYVVPGVSLPLSFYGTSTLRRSKTVEELSGLAGDKGPGAGDCDKWFGLGLGKPVPVAEIEPLNMLSPVKPRTVEVLDHHSPVRKHCVNPTKRSSCAANDPTDECEPHSRQGSVSNNKRRTFSKRPLLSQQRSLPNISSSSVGKASVARFPEPQRSSIAEPHLKLPRVNEGHYNGSKR